MSLLTCLTSVIAIYYDDQRFKGFSKAEELIAL